MESLRSKSHRPSLGSVESLSSLESYSSNDSSTYHPGSYIVQKAEPVQIYTAKPVLLDLNSTPAPRTRTHTRTSSGSSTASSSSSSSSTSTIRRSKSVRVRSCWNMAPEEARDLWKCMLELQQQYGCYKSRRVDLAMGANSEDVVNLMPSRFIMDSMNGSIEDLPEEGWARLNEKLHLKPGGGRGKLRKKLWIRT